MLQTVIFDLDGTLLDTLADLAGAGNFVCRENGWPEHPVASYRQMVGRGIPNLVSRFSPPGQRAPEAQARALAQFSDYYGAHNLDKTRPYDGMEALTAQLRAAGLTLAVFSNKADPFSREIVEHFFPGVFHAVRGKLPGVPAKPDPAGLLRLMEEMDARRETTLFVGDSDVDMETARNAGLPACGVTWGFRPRTELAALAPAYLADTPAELERILLARSDDRL